MPKTQRTVFEPGVYIGLRLRRANETAELQFAKIDNSALKVTIPAVDLIRLRADIDRKIRRAPELAARASKTGAAQS